LRQPCIDLAGHAERSGAGALFLEVGGVVDHLRDDSARFLEELHRPGVYPDAQADIVPNRLVRLDAEHGQAVEDFEAAADGSHLAVITPECEQPAVARPAPHPALVNLQPVLEKVPGPVVHFFHHRRFVFLHQFAVLADVHRGDRDGVLLALSKGTPPM
jgi:hypothetical protein